MGETGCRDTMVGGETGPMCLLFDGQSAAGAAEDGGHDDRDDEADDGEGDQCRGSSGSGRDSGDASDEQHSEDHCEHDGQCFQDEVRTAALRLRLVEVQTRP